MRSVGGRRSGRSMRVQRRGSWFAIALILAVIGAFWVHRVHIDRPTDHGFPSSDMSRYFYPTAVYMHRELQRGHLPLWNPYQMAGMPALASLTQGLLYPPNAIALYWLRPARALEVLAVAHLALAAGLTFAFARHIGLSHAASIAAALAFALSGAMLRTLYNPAFLSTCAWLPGLLWAVSGLVREVRLRWSIVLGSIGALAFLGGYAQGFLFEIQIAAAYGVAALVFVRRPRRIACCGLAVGSGLIVAGLVAAQLAPSLELLRSVPRATEGLSVAEATLVQPPISDVIGGLVGSGRPSLSSTILLIPLTLLGLASVRTRRHWAFFATAALVSGLFALGTHAFVFEIYHALPLGGLFRFPSRISFVYVFCLSMLVGIGIEGACALAIRIRPKTPRAVMVVGVLLAGSVAVDLYSRSALPFSLPILSGETRYVPDRLLKQIEARRFDGRVFVENFSHHYSPTLPNMIGIVNEIFAVPTYEPMIPREYTSWFGQEKHWRGFVSTVRHVGRKRRFLHVATPTSLPPGALLRMLDAMSVRFYVSEASLAGRRLAELERFAGAPSVKLGTGRWIERDAAVPRAYAVHKLIVEPDPQRALEQIRSGAFNLHEYAVVDRPVDGIDRAESARDSVRISSYGAEEVSLSARCDSACLVVLTDLHFVGWNAEVDGLPAVIHRVNGLFRGVRVSAGTHEVVYRYKPVSARVGAVISVATLAGLGLGGGLWLFVRTGRRGDRL